MLEKSEILNNSGEEDMSLEELKEKLDKRVFGFLGGKMQDLVMKKSDSGDLIYDEKLIRAYQDLAVDGNFYNAPNIEKHLGKEPKALYDYLKDQLEYFEKMITDDRQKELLEHNKAMTEYLKEALELLDKQKEQQA